MTEIERLKNRINDNMKKLTRDINKLFDIVEERGKLIDTLARENEHYANLEDDDDANLGGEKSGNF